MHGDFAVLDLGHEKDELPRNLASDDSSAMLRLAMVSVALFSIWAAYRFFLPDSLQPLNLWMPITIAACCVWGIVHLVRTNALWMWSPLVSLLAAFAVFHGLGPLLHVLGDPLAIAYANQFARIDEEDLAATNTLDLASLALLLISFAGFFFFRKRTRFHPQTNRNRRSPKGISIFICLIIGSSLPLKYFVVLPYFLGWDDPSFVLPGVVVALGNLSFLCLFLLFYQAWTRNSAFYFPAAVLFLLEIATGLFSFNKSEIIIALGVCFLGLYLARPSKQLAAGAITIIAIIYFLITPIVSKGREYLKPNPANVAERIEALERAWHGNEDTSASSVQGWWTRLCYVNAQSFAMHQFDAGITGDSFALILPALIPRVIWSDKPIMTPGYQFNELATGNRHSSSAPGVFAEAYWNYGWAAVLAVCVYMGLLLNWFTQVAFIHVARRDLRWLPFGVGGLLMGASITDWFASTYVGGVLTFGVYLAIVKVIMPSPLESSGGNFANETVGVEISA